MRVLAISHSCVLPVNQRVFATLEERTKARIALLVPERWISEYDGSTIVAEQLESSAYRFFTAPVAGRGNINLHTYTRLPLREIKAFKPDVVLSGQEPYSLSGLQAACLASFLRVPFLFQTNQNILKHYPPPFSWIESLSFKRAAVALAYSEEARQVMLSKGLRRPSAVLPYATDLARFTPRAGPSPVRVRFDLSEAWVIGFLGRLVPEKGLDTVIDAVIALATELPNLRLLLVGSGPEEASLRERAALGGVGNRIIFAGSVPHEEAALYLQAMDVFVLASRTRPNWKEQFGRVLIEAMACGVPVVGSDSGEIPNLIRATGGGLVFPEGDASSLSERLRTLFADECKRRTLGETGAQSARGSYSCEAVADRLYEHLQNAVATTRRVVAFPSATPDSD